MFGVSRGAPPWVRGSSQNRRNIFMRACGVWGGTHGNTTHTIVDAGLDTRVDAGGDTIGDAGLDTRVDAGGDTIVDAGLDTRVDAGAGLRSTLGSTHTNTNTHHRRRGRGHHRRRGRWPGVYAGLGSTLAWGLRWPGVYAGLGLGL